MDIILENIRCFHGRHEVSLAPLTLLVGENSSGKTTFLAILSALANSHSFPIAPGFNIPPYDLGSYENIASRRSATSRPAQFIRIGFSEREAKKGCCCTRVTTYKEHLGQLTLSQLQLFTPRGKVEINISNRQIDGNIESNFLGRSVPFSINIPEREIKNLNDFLKVFYSEETKSTDLTTGKSISIDIILDMYSQLYEVSLPFSNVFSMAPIRTKPRRTYDQFNDEFKPEGDHVPLHLASVLESKEDPQLKVDVVSGLREFGRESGLFTEVEIFRFGKTPSSPFQVLVHVDGLASNLLDVGYGVSQSLPLVVQSVLAKPKSLLLMQQPEVHLHPKAQAALGSLFSRLAKTKRTQFVVETHSDFLLDRVRQEVARGTIGQEDVAILFFHKQNGKTTIHPLALDAQGNILNAPPGYRQFFLEEELVLLSRGASPCVPS